MNGLHLVTVLATNGDGPGSVVTVRSLCDRKLACRRALKTIEGGGKEADVEARGVKVYASPGYAGSGVFVVAAEGGRGECAIVWRAAFDEGDFLLLWVFFFQGSDCQVRSRTEGRGGRSAYLRIVPFSTVYQILLERVCLVCRTQSEMRGNGACPLSLSRQGALRLVGEGRGVVKMT